jgi:hypothetical protein
MPGGPSRTYHRHGRGATGRAGVDEAEICGRERPSRSEFANVHILNASPRPSWARARHDHPSMTRGPRGSMNPSKDSSYRSGDNCLRNGPSGDPSGPARKHLHERLFGGEEGLLALGMPPPLRAGTDRMNPSGGRGGQSREVSQTRGLHTLSRCRPSHGMLRLFPKAPAVASPRRPGVARGFEGHAGTQRIPSSC